MENYQPAAIVKLFGEKIPWVIVSKRTKNYVAFKRYGSGKHYIIKTAMIEKQVGTLEADDDDYKHLDGTPDPAEATRGKRFAEMMMTSDPANAEKWLCLATTEPGETVNVRRRSGIKPHTLKCVMTRGQKYHFAATTPRGASYKFPIGSLVLPTE
jgi:hypothetical protein